MRSWTNPYISFSHRSVSLDFFGVGRDVHRPLRLAKPKVEICEVDSHNPHDIDSNNKTMKCNVFRYRENRRE